MAYTDILFLLDHADEFQHEFKLGVGNGGLAASPAAASSSLQAGAGSLPSAVFLSVTAPGSLSHTLSSPMQDADV